MPFTHIQFFFIYTVYYIGLKVSHTLFWVKMGERKWKLRKMKIFCIFPYLVTEGNWKGNEKQGETHVKNFFYKSLNLIGSDSVGWKMKLTWCSWVKPKLLNGFMFGALFSTLLFAHWTTDRVSYILLGSTAMRWWCQSKESERYTSNWEMMFVHQKFYIFFTFYLYENHGIKILW